MQSFNDLTLADAIIYHNLHDVKGIVESGVDLNDFDEYGFTPLVEAAIFDKWDIAAFLLKKGAKVDQKDLVGRTALHWACENNQLKMVRLLLENAADANAYGKAGQSPLVFPFLRHHEQLKQLLISHGASLDFAKDYINTKLLGHRFELKGRVHLFTPAKKFFLLDYEGFHLEFTLAVIQDSLARYKKNYAARHLKGYLTYLQKMIDALRRASQLIQYQHHTPKYKENEQEINQLLNDPLILLPVAYEGHAITCISYKNIWVKIDRGWNSRTEGSVVIYQVTHPEWVNKNFFKHLLYKKHSADYVNHGINQQIGLVKIGEMPLPPQVIGNCSWANVEGSVAAMFFLLDFVLQEPQNIYKIQTIFHNVIERAIQFFDEWREWDKDRALEECVSEFNYADSLRKASKASVLAAVLTQKCSYKSKRDLLRAEKILPILCNPKYLFILEAHIKVLFQLHKNEFGENLINLLDLAAPKGVVFESLKNLVEFKDSE